MPSHNAPRYMAIDFGFSTMNLISILKLKVVAVVVAFVSLLFARIVELGMVLTVSRERLKTRINVFLVILLE